MKIVCDTNVLVSGVLFGGPPRQILVLAARGKITNVVSPPLLREAEDVLLRRKFGLTPEQVLGIMALLRDTFELVNPSHPVNAVPSDPADNAVLEAAAEVSADFIVSGDKHLLGLDRWEGIRIVTPAAVLNELVGT